MIIQCAADFHGRKERYKQFSNSYKKTKPDIVILAGDLGHVPKDFLDVVETKIYAVYGNIDGNLSHLNDKVEFIDDKIINFDNFTIVGLKDNEKISNLPIKKVDFLVTHFPPYGFQDKAIFGMHIGSKIVKEAIIQLEPKFVICGHVHENAGYSTHSKTTIVNCSIGKEGSCTIIDSESGNIEMYGYR